MKGDAITVVRVFLTPDDLREAAAKAEEVWGEGTPGRSLLIGVWHGGNFKVELVVDQKEMSKEPAKRTKGMLRNG